MSAMKMSSAMNPTMIGGSAIMGQLGVSRADPAQRPTYLAGGADADQAVGAAQPAAALSLIIPRTGLNLPHRLSFDRWLSIGKQLAVTTSSSAWCLGDWLIYGETSFTGRYRRAIEQTSLEYKTLRNYAWVARKFPQPRRRGTLSFGHHAEVAALPEPEQDFWLRKAEALNWSRNEMRHMVQASLKERNGRERGAGQAGPVSPELPEPAQEWELAGAAEPASSPALALGGGDQFAHCPPGPATLGVEVTAEQFARIRQAASLAGLTVSAWAAVTLDRAARDVLRCDSTAG
jgi:hypothetical protein